MPSLQHVYIECNGPTVLKLCFPETRVTLDGLGPRYSSCSRNAVYIAPATTSVAHLYGPELVCPLLFLVQALNSQGGFFFRENRREVELHLTRCQGLIVLFKVTHGGEGGWSFSSTAADV